MTPTPLTLVEIDRASAPLPSEGTYRFQIGDEVAEFTGTYLQFVGFAKREAALRGLRKVTLLP